MGDRVKELDYLKSVFIVLMVIFHLVYIGDSYPYIKKIVYTFHMPAFLIISGYLVSVYKKSKPFFQGLLWVFIPYAGMEIGYVILSSILPVREGVTEISVLLLMKKVFLSPLGPYWYLHTLILCSATYYVLYNYVRLENISRLILLALCFYVMSHELGILSFPYAVYFMIGVAVSQSKQRFMSIFRPSGLSLIPLILLCYYPENLDSSTLSGVVITYLAICLSLFLYCYIPSKIKEICHFIGRNTFIILLFSPIFTILSKMFLPFFSFDSSGICFMCVAVVFVVTGCLAIAWIMDWLRLSRFCFGKERVMQ